MKSVVSKLVLSAFVTTMFANIVMADGSAFTPLNFDDTAYTPAYSTTSTSAQTPETAGNESMQSAIQKLDTAQIEVRNELLNYKTQFADIDAQYTSYKAQRKAMKAQIKSVERRIRQIDSAKEKIRKNMV